jgi:hypothetical protein
VTRIFLVSTCDYEPHHIPLKSPHHLAFKLWARFTNSLKLLKHTHLKPTPTAQIVGDKQVRQKVIQILNTKCHVPLFLRFSRVTLEISTPTPKCWTCLSYTISSERNKREEYPFHHSSAEPCWKITRLHNSS